MGNKQPHADSSTKVKKTTSRPIKQTENTEKPENEKDHVIIQSKNSDLKNELKLPINRNSNNNINSDHFDIEIGKNEVSNGLKFVSECLGILSVARVII